MVKVLQLWPYRRMFLDLMNYTRGFKTLNPEQEYVTISMENGQVSLTSVTRSVESFASLDEA